MAQTRKTWIPTMQNLPDGYDIRNWLINSGTSAHMTPNFSDFSGKLWPTDKVIEVVDGTEICCTKMGKVLLYIHSDNRINITGVMHDFLFMPELTR